MDDEIATPDPREMAEQVILGAVVNSRAVDAYQLRRQGKRLSQIADDLGYSDAKEVLRAIAEQMKVEAEMLTTMDRHGILQMENDRLDELQAVYYQSALLGDFDSLKAVLTIIDKRIKINKLDAVDTQDQQHTVLVVGGTEADYVAKLKELD